eukprot:gnl/TRDRNA2_/TRDRNA2_193091_c0_seq1.p1 gnl/TRDRNA2_/TRDRNA2_193091_c0~~gnl/TRDRNA2_/TRDRNA2_193091_c0_seq1.p1  ORF type:complete len:426 (+),score=60.91 gnl/TRDRNA2_/TRDRNA2_193091_c0_seq1:22-1299(+)
MEGMAYGGRSGRISSNAFACGSNLNSGNFLGDMPSTRVVRPPGGASTFSFGWEDPPAPASREVAAPRSFETGPPSPKERPGQGQRQSQQLLQQQAPDSPMAMQPRGSPTSVAGGRLRQSSNQFASGMNMNSGNVLCDKPSTRVASPPGGASSFSLGWGDPQNAVPSQRPQHVPPAGGYSRMQPPPLAPDSYSPHQMRSCSTIQQPPSPTSPTTMQQAGGERWTPPSQNGSPRCVPGSPRMEQMQAQGVRRNSGQAGSDLRAAGAPADTQQMTFGQRPRVSGNTFSCGSNPNGPGMLSNIPSTRVTRPPGGQTSMSLAWGEDDRRDRSSGSGGDHRTKAQKAYGGGDAASCLSWGEDDRDNGRGNSNGGRRLSQQHDSQGAFGVRPRPSSNTFACGSDQNCGNMITDTPSTRVLRPPGGVSTICFG